MRLGERLNSFATMKKMCYVRGVSLGVNGSCRKKVVALTVTYVVEI